MLIFTHLYFVSTIKFISSFWILVIRTILFYAYSLKSYFADVP